MTVKINVKMKMNTIPKFWKYCGHFSRRSISAVALLIGFGGSFDTHVRGKPFSDRPQSPYHTQWYFSVHCVNCNIQYNNNEINILFWIILQIISELKHSLQISFDENLTQFNSFLPWYFLIFFFLRSYLFNYYILWIYYTLRYILDEFVIVLLLMND